MPTSAFVDAIKDPHSHVRRANELGGLPTPPKSGVLLPALELAFFRSVVIVVVDVEEVSKVGC